MVDLISRQLVFASTSGVKITSRLLTQHLIHRHACVYVLEEGRMLRIFHYHAEARLVQAQRIRWFAVLEVDLTVARKVLRWCLKECSKTV